MRCKSTNLDSIVQLPALQFLPLSLVPTKTANYLWFLCFGTWYLPMNEIWSQRKTSLDSICLSSSNLQHTHIFCLSFTLQKETPRIFLVGVFLFRHCLCLLFQILKYGNTAGFFTEFLRTCHFLSLAVERMKSHVPFKRPEISSDSIAMGLRGETTYGETFGEAVQVNFTGSIRMVNPCQLSNDDMNMMSFWLVVLKNHPSFKNMMMLVNSWQFIFPSFWLGAENS